MESDTGDAARAALLDAVALRHAEVDAAMLAGDALPAVAAGLGAAFRALPDCTGARRAADFADGPAFEAFLRRLRYANTLMVCGEGTGGAGAGVGAQLRGGVDAQLVRGALCEALFRTSEHAARVATARAHAIVAELAAAPLRGGLFEDMLCMLLGPAAGSASGGEAAESASGGVAADAQCVIGLLLARVDDMNEALACATIDLLAECTAVGGAHAVAALALDAAPCACAAGTSCADARARVTEGSVIAFCAAFGCEDPCEGGGGGYAESAMAVVSAAAAESAMRWPTLPRRVLPSPLLKVRLVACCGEPRAESHARFVRCTHCSSSLLRV